MPDDSADAALSLIASDAVFAEFTEPSFDSAQFASAVIAADQGAAARGGGGARAPPAPPDGGGEAEQRSHAEVVLARMGRHVEAIDEQIHRHIAQHGAALTATPARNEPFQDLNAERKAPTIKRRLRTTVADVAIVAVDAPQLRAEPKWDRIRRRRQGQFPRPRPREPAEMSLSFNCSYVCPEPVLTNTRLLAQTGLTAKVFSRAESAIGIRRCW